MKKVLVFLLAVLLVVPFQSADAKRKGLKRFKRSKITKPAKGVRCAQFKGEWHPIKIVKRNGRRFFKKAKRAKQSKKDACGSLLEKNAVRSLAQLPSNSSITGSSSADIPFDVSGTPPKISEIPRLDVSALFWRDGVIDRIVDGEPSAEDCNEFWSGNNDGHSGGMNACYMTQQVGYSFEHLLASGMSRCFLTNAPTVENFEGGGISLVSGELPEGDVTKVFDSPEGETSRIVKVQITGFDDEQERDSAYDGASQTIYVRVYSQSENEQEKNQAKYDLWFCSDNQSTTTESEQLVIKDSGEFSSSSFGRDYQATLTAFLKEEGESLVFDETKSRIISALFSNDDFYFNSHISFNSSNELTVKSIDRDDFGTRYSYSKALIQGASIGDVRYLAGGYKDKFKNSNSDNFKAFTEYRDSLYTSTENSEYQQQINSFDFSKDNFYDKAPRLSQGESFDCTANADVVVGMDFSQESMQAVRDLCEGERLDGMNYCRNSDSLEYIEDDFYDYCEDDEEF